MHKDFKIALFEPHGSGGIAHYTYQLSRHLAKYIPIVLYTLHNYELKDLNINFLLRNVIEKSILKDLITQKTSSKLYNTNVHFVSHKTLPRYKKSRVYNILRQIYLELELLSLLKMDKVSIVHFQWVWPNEFSLRFTKFIKLLKIKTVYTAHNILPHDVESSKIKEAFQKWYHLYDHIIVHSEKNKEELLKMFNIDSKKISVIAHGHYSFIPTKEISKIEARKLLKIPTNKIYFLFFGLIRKYKGLDLLLESFSMLVKETPNVGLIIAGKLVPYEGKDIHYFNKKFKDLNIEKNVFFCPQYIDFKKVPIFFAAADIVVLPYLKTYQSGVAFLAYAHKRPIIATNTGALSEVIEEGKSGFLVSKISINELYETLKKAILNKDNLTDMGIYAYNMANKKYSWEKIALKTIQIYVRVMEES